VVIKKIWTKFASNVSRPPPRDNIDTIPRRLVLDWMVLVGISVHRSNINLFVYPLIKLKNDNRRGFGE